MFEANEAAQIMEERQNLKVLKDLVARGPRACNCPVCIAIDGAVAFYMAHLEKKHRLS